MTNAARLVSLAVTGLALALATGAQPAAPQWRIGFLGAESAATSRHVLDAFRHGLHDLGYVEGQHITIEARWAEGQHDRFPALVAELVRLPVHVLLAISTPAALAAKQETPALPIVFIGGEPLRSGLVGGLAQPGGNLTGVSLALGEEFAGKWLELLREALPTVSQVAILWHPANAANVAYVTALQASAQRLGVTLQPQGVQDPSHLEHAFAAMATARAQALIVLTDPLTVRYRDLIVALAAHTGCRRCTGFGSLWRRAASWPTGRVSPRWAGGPPPMWTRS